jgi:hypothetical protein
MNNMRKVFLVLFLFFVVGAGPAQVTDSLGKDSKQQVRTGESSQDSLDRAIMNNNLNAFARMQQERDKKQRQQMYIRIALGVFFLVVLVVGLTRKRKQKNNTA